MAAVRRTRVHQQHLAPAAQIERPFGDHLVVGRHKDIGGLRRVLFGQALPHRVGVQFVRPVPQHIPHAPGAVHLRPGEGGRAQHMIEMGVAECDMCHPLAQQRLRLAAYLHRFTQ